MVLVVLVAILVLGTDALAAGGPPDYKNALEQVGAAQAGGPAALAGTIQGWVYRLFEALVRWSGWIFGTLGVIGFIMRTVRLNLLWKSHGTMMIVVSAGIYIFIQFLPVFITLAVQRLPGGSLPWTIPGTGIR